MIKAIFPVTAEFRNQNKKAWYIKEAFAFSDAGDVSGDFAD
jgi:hypothetical protein